MEGRWSVPPGRPFHDAPECTPPSAGLLPTEKRPHAMAGSSEQQAKTWTFLTNHAHVLIAISRDPQIRQREIADSVGITLGAVQRIVQELEAAGYLVTERVGRRNRYQVVAGRPLRHPLEEQTTVTDLLSALDR